MTKPLMAETDCLKPTHLNTEFDTMLVTTRIIHVMKNKIHYAVSVLFLLVFSTQVHADTYEVDAFEIAGVRFGMLPEEAKQAVAKFYSLNADDVAVIPIDEADPYPGLQHIKPLDWLVECRRKGLLVRVNFAASLDHKDDGYMIARSVTTEYRGARVRDLRAQQELDYKNAVEKYGPPTYEQILPPSWKYSWCAKKNPDSNKIGCDRNDSQLEISDTHTKWINPKIEKQWFANADNWPKP